ncbi:MAG: metallophosphoesterase [Pseudomonadota bacterium]
MRNDYEPINLNKDEARPRTAQTEPRAPEPDETRPILRQIAARARAARRAARGGARGASIPLRRKAETPPRAKAAPPRDAWLRGGAAPELETRDAPAPKRLAQQPELRLGAPLTPTAPPRKPRAAPRAGGARTAEQTAAPAPQARWERALPRVLKQLLSALLAPQRGAPSAAQERGASLPRLAAAPPRRGGEGGPDFSILPPARVAERLYIVGDIHGRADLLDEMLAVIEAEIGDETARRGAWLVFLGDYIDRGDQSRAVIERLREIQRGRRLYGVSPVFLRGNHEQLLLQALDSPAALPTWLAHGGLQTLWSYGVRPPAAADPEALAAAHEAIRAAFAPHLEFFKGLRRSFRRGALFCAHAGIDPDVSLAMQSEEALLWGAPDFYERGGPEDVVVAHGHRIAEAVDVAPGRVGLDTGAFATGRLSALRVDPQDGYSILQTGR